MNGHGLPTPAGIGRVSLVATRKHKIGTGWIRTAALVCAAQLVASPAPGQAPDFGVPVTADGIREIIARHHFVHPLPDSREYVITYGSDGTTDLVVRSGERFAGAWSIDGSNRLCLSWPGHPGPDCFSVFLDGALLRLVDSSGRVAGQTPLPGTPPSWLEDLD